MEIITKAQAKSMGLTKYFDGVPCKYGHLSERFLSGNCCECKRAMQTKRYAEDPEHRQRKKLLAKEWYGKNQQRAQAAMAEWRDKNSGKKRMMDRNRHHANKEHINAKRRAEWGDDDRRKAREWQAKRFASNPVAALAARMRCYLSSSLRYNSWAKNKRTEDVLG